MSLPPAERHGAGLAFRLILWPALRPNRWALLVVGLILLVQASCYVLRPILYRLIFDRVIVTRDAGPLVPLLLAMAVLFLVMVVAELGQARLTAGLGAAAATRLRRALFALFQRLPSAEVTSGASGAFLERYSADMAALDLAVTLAGHKVALSLLVATLSVAGLFVVDWRLASVTALVLILAATIPRLIGRRAKAARAERTRFQGLLAAMVQEMLAAHRLVRAFGLERHREAVVAGLLAEAEPAARRANLFSAYVEKSTYIGVIFGQASIIGGGAWLVLHGDLTAGALVAFMGLLLNATSAITTLAAFLPDVMAAVAALKGIGALLAAPSEEAEEAPRAPFRFAREIRFDAVSFSYGEGLALDSVSFSIAAGQSVAFVGRSGSGKSTIVALLMGFQRPSAGAITVDGVDLRAIDASGLRAAIGCVFQESFLFDSSIRDNIRQGRLDAGDDGIEAAARAAMMHETIGELPHGYETRVGERGTLLSGGQRQRVAVARAILRDPAILIADEATSALDPPTEAAVNETLDGLARGRTRITITHRLGTATTMDRIFVLEKGRLVEEGTHEALLARGGAYHALWQKQTGCAMNSTGTQAKISSLFLATLPIFAGLDPEHLASYAAEFASELHEEGATLIREGEIGDKLYVIVRGRVEVTSRSSEQRWVLEEGDFFGEIALLADRPRTATVRALEPCLLLSLTRTQFRTVLDGSPQLRAQFEAVTGERLRRLGEAPLLD